MPDPPVVADDDVTFTDRGPVRDRGTAPRGLGDVRLAVGAFDIFLWSDTRVGLCRRAGDVRRRRLVTNI